MDNGVVHLARRYRLFFKSKQTDWEVPKPSSTMEQMRKHGMQPSLGLLTQLRRIMCCFTMPIGWIRATGRGNFWSAHSMHKGGIELWSYMRWRNSGYCFKNRRMKNRVVLGLIFKIELDESISKNAHSLASSIEFAWISIRSWYMYQLDFQMQSLLQGY